MSQLNKILNLSWLAFGLLTANSMNGQFIEVTFGQNIVVTSTGSVFGNGCSFADFNMDGWPDLSVTRNASAPKFYLNNQGQFSEAQMGIPNWGNTDQKSILWADYDNDGDRDLLISPNYEPIRLYRNDGNLESLVDVTEEVGLASQSVRNYGASWVDYDRDGFLDLYICKYHNPVFSQGYEYTNHLYRNLGDGTFQDMTLFAGVGDGVKASFQSLFFDYNNDLWPDLYVINDRVNTANSLYQNNGDGTFTDVSVESGTNVYIDAMCGNAGDFDHDGDLDIYVTNSLAGHHFFINNGDGTFTEEAEERGVYLEDIGWGSLWLDYQNDTWQDLFIASTGNEGTTEFQNRFFLNESDGTFIDYLTETYLEGDLDATYSVAMADFDRDGWVDFFTHNGEQSASSLWKNISFNSSSNHWLQINLQGTVSNREAIGTWIEVYVSGDLLTQYTTCGYNYISQDSFTNHFGLGEATQADSVIIKWPSGLVENYYDIQANQQIDFVEGNSLYASLNLSGEYFICEGDSINLTLNEAFDFTWSTGVTSDTLSTDTAGVYFAIVSASEGFTFNSDSLTLNVIPSIEIQATTSDALCFGSTDGSVSLEIEGGEPPYAVNWFGFNPDSLFAGTFEALVEDDFGCLNQIAFEIEQPDQLSILTENAQIIDDECETSEYNSGSVFISGGTEPYSVTWTFDSPQFADPIIVDGESFDCIPNTEGLTFEILIIDANGCTIEDQGELDFFVGIKTHQPQDIQIYPNPVKDELFIKSAGIDLWKIYNSQGKLILCNDEPSEFNQTRISVTELPGGVYVLEFFKNGEVDFIRFLKD